VNLSASGAVTKSEVTSSAPVASAFEYTASEKVTVIVLLSVATAADLIVGARFSSLLQDEKPIRTAKAMDKNKKALFFMFDWDLKDYYLVR
jgi:hypothetical protein